MNKLNKKILAFAEEQNMYIVDHYDKYYTITSEGGILLGCAQPDCSYEQFLTRIALKAIYEAERLRGLVNEMEEEKYYIELSADALADELKEKERSYEN